MLQINGSKKGYASDWTNDEVDARKAYLDPDFQNLCNWGFTTAAGVPLEIQGSEFNAPEGAIVKADFYVSGKLFDSVSKKVTDPEYYDANDDLFGFDIKSSKNITTAQAPAWEDSVPYYIKVTLSYGKTVLDSKTTDTYSVRNLIEPAA
jgi:hypothetical protein